MPTRWFARSADTATSAGSLPIAAPWRRLVARVADAAAVLAVLWMLAVLQVLWFLDDAVDRLHPEPWGEALPPLIAFVVLSAVYEIAFLTSSGGQTPGKDLLDVRVVPIAGTERVSVGRAMLRWFVPGLAVLVWPLWLGVLVMLATAIPVPLGRRRRALHDLLAGTQVVDYRHSGKDQADDDLDDHGGGDDDLDTPTSGSVAMELLFGPRRRARRRPVSDRVGSR